MRRLCIILFSFLCLLSSSNTPNTDLFIPPGLTLALDVFRVREAYADEVLDLTTFTESDPTSRLTVSSDCVTFTNVESRNANTYVSKAYVSEVPKSRATSRITNKR